MNDRQEWPQERRLRRNHWIRKGVAIALLLTCLKVWIGPTRLIERAEAQIPDAGLQRKQLLDEARLTNLLLGEIKQILEKGTINVRTNGADNQADPAPIPRSPGR